MADKSAIEWTDATWNPVTGCSVVSPGCTNCYAMRLAGTRLQHHPSRAGLTTMSKAGPVWTGEVRFNEQWLCDPIRWKRPRYIFVCAHGDLFHKAVSDEQIDRVMAVMAVAPQHTYQVPTKRARRMREYLSDPRRPYQIARAVVDLMIERKLPKTYKIGDDWPVVSEGNDIDNPDDITLMSWPLPNVWLGVSTEDQQRADERIPDLLATSAAVRFVSAEPLLGPIDLTNIPLEGGRYDALRGEWTVDIGGPGDGCDSTRHGLPRLDQVIVGGESGPGARPMHPDWVRSLRDQCKAAGVPFFFKQWGAWAPLGDREGNVIDASGNTAWPDGTIGGGNAAEKGGRGRYLYRASKSIAGRLLDGVEHNAMPEVRHG